ncbi:hypothetical protein PR048_033442 [Dryococelus australis]|uniref:Uncharacterized protein n=1 Tax=Dryococelus australis TaxID=614101 RepID=A0ABQ9G4G4_9NEOP|nr:hypothetical protein PR048_033442 [Dryococelus australis]
MSPHVNLTRAGDCNCENCSELPLWYHRPDEGERGEYGDGAGMKGRGKREIPRKPRRPTASSGTIPTREKAVARPGIEPDSPWWEASRLTTQLSWTPPKCGRGGEVVRLLASRKEDLAGSLSDFRLWESSLTMLLQRGLERRWMRAKRRSARVEKTGNPRENPPVSGIVLHDSHERKSETVSLLASQQGDWGSIPGPGRSAFSHMVIVPDDAVGRRVFSGNSRFPHPFIPVLFHTYLNHPHRLSRPRWSSGACLIYCDPIAKNKGRQVVYGHSLGDGPVICIANTLIYTPIYCNTSPIQQFFGCMVLRHCRFQDSALTASRPYKGSERPLLPNVAHKYSAVAFAAHFVALADFLLPRLCEMLQAARRGRREARVGASSTTAAEDVGMSFHVGTSGSEELVALGVQPPVSRLSCGLSLIA